MYTPKEESHFDREHKVYVENLVKSMHRDNYDKYCAIVDTEFAVTEVRKAVSSLVNKKAAGFDAISNEHVKHGGTSLILILTKLFNMFLSEEHIPCDALKGVIITLPKSGKTNPDLRENHRGITLLPALYKLFEKIILERIRTMCFLMPLSHINE